MNWEFTGEQKEHYGVLVRRIRATRDFILKSGIQVTKGDIGGWIEKESNLTDNAWVGGNAIVYGDANVSGDACIHGNASVYVLARVYGNAEVYGDARVNGLAAVYGNAKVYGNASVSNYSCVSGDALVCGNAYLYDYVKVFERAYIHGNAVIHNNAWVYGNAGVHDEAYVYGSANVCGNACVCGKATIGGETKLTRSKDYMVFKNSWSSGRWFTYTRPNKMWSVGCFYGTGEELIKKAYADSELKGKCYELIVNAVTEIDKITDENNQF